MKEIPVSRNQVTLVDDDDYEKLIKYKWSLDGKRYAHTRIVFSLPCGKLATR